MQFIVKFIRKKEDELIGQSDRTIESLDQEWSEFLKRDTYLIYEDKSYFLKKLVSAQKISKVPWYLFWHFKLKKRLVENAEKLEQYFKTIYAYNEDFVAKKKVEYKSLFKKENITLDDDQQTAVITDDKNNLVVAGAGSGKTEVLITRVAYLVKRKSDRIKPERILALAFQNKAANEMKERLKERYDLDVEIRTFHSLGKKIIIDYSKVKKIEPPQLKEECSDEWKFQRYIQSIFSNLISNDHELQNDAVNFMKSYGDDEVIKDETDFQKKEEFYEYQRNLTYTALDGTKVKSEAERKIVNFFLMHKLNGKSVKILYEDPADWMKYTNEEGEEIVPKPDFYFPEFDLYWEHWAIDKEGKVPQWFAGEDPTKEYTDAMNIKKEKYSENQKTLVETSQADYTKPDFQQILADKFISALEELKPDEHFTFEPLSYHELIDSVWESAKFVKQMPLNISRYIVIAKTYSMYPDEMLKRIESRRWSPKQKRFSKIALKIFEKYQTELEKGNHIDFSDMINVAVKHLKSSKELYKDTYDHILIDEYQDISTQRYELIKELMNKNERCKLFCVGDDWQSIMGFAGSNLDFFIHFEKYFPHPARTDLTKNYRSIKSIVDVGASIIKNNKSGQIEKETVANSDEEKPILVYSSKHQKSYFSQYYEQIARHCMDKIKEYHTERNYPYGDFMILMRIAKKKKLRNYISEYAKSLGIPITEKADRPNSVRIMSVHRSKGLQAKVVIILNVDKDLYGFPCQLENPDIFYPVMKNDDGLRKQEERRLFYVAVTRAKEEVIMYTQKCSESDFITEIKDFTKREELGY